MSDSASRARAVLDLFEAYYERVFCFARRSLPPEQAEDVAQEVFVRLLDLKNLERLELSVSYLLKIADNLIKRGYGRAKRFSEYAKASRAAAGAEAAESPAEGAPEEDRIAASLERLAAHEQAAVRLIVCQGLSYEQAARSLGVEVSTVNNWKHRGLHKLQRHHRGDDAADEPAACGRRSRGRREQAPRPPEAAGRDHGSPFAGTGRSGAAGGAADGLSEAGDGRDSAPLNRAG